MAVNPSVLLLAMPWNRADYPSVQVGLLKASLIRRDIRVRAVYSYLYLAKILGDDLYHRVADLLHPVLGEGFFAEHVESRVNPFLSEECLKTGELRRPEIKFLRRAIAEFLDRLFSMFQWQEFDVVGFTCSFNQLFASLSLAQRIKEAYPRIRIVMGGSNLHGQSGKRVIATYKFIDCIISGPGEEALANYVLKGQVGDKLFMFGRPIKTEHVPIPDYDEFFNEAGDPKNLCLIACASYGCSYGLCAFCTQNTEVGFHPLSVKQVVKSVTILSDRYPARMVEFADTSFPYAILDHETTVKFASTGRSFFAEMLPNLDDNRTLSLRKAGFSTIQLGIESFSTAVLHRMRKPTDLVNNVYNLRLAYEHCINVTYNLILDFPPFCEKENKDMLVVIPAIFHLFPPSNLLQFMLQNGSDVHMNPQRFGLSSIEPHRYYRAVTERYFEEEGLVPAYLQYLSPDPESEIFMAIDDLCRTWEQKYDPENSCLCYEQSGETLVVADRRNGVMQKYHLTEKETLLLMHLFKPRAINVDSGNGFVLGEECFDQEFDCLLEKRLILHDNGKAVALPVSKKHRSLGKVFVNSAFCRA